MGKQESALDRLADEEREAMDFATWVAVREGDYP